MKLHWEIPLLNSETIALIYGFLGVVGFSLTLPATRAAAIDLDPLFVGLGRGVCYCDLNRRISSANALPISAKPARSQRKFLAGDRL